MTRPMHHALANVAVAAAFVFEACAAGTPPRRPPPAQLPDAQDVAEEIPEAGSDAFDASPEVVGDQDHDRIADDVDRCPTEAERYNGVDDEDGCPDRPPLEMCIWIDYVVILQRVSFARDRADVRAGDPFVRAIAQTLVANPQIERVGVVGGAASGERDPDALSLARARSVFDRLVALGVEPARMEVHGLGLGAPRESAPALDRSVWFPILRMEGVDARDHDGVPDSRLFAWHRDCEAARREWEQGSAMDCDCLDRERERERDR